jgi:hypothetical protein
MVNKGVRLSRREAISKNYKEGKDVKKREEN